MFLIIAVCGRMLFCRKIGRMDSRTEKAFYFRVKRTFAIRFRYLLMNAVALRTVSGSF